MEIRTRVAPSPTGAPHIGTAYIALFNYAFAKHHGGTFVLRIEDTDQVRSTVESEQAILDALRWVGVPWDEGPDCGGSYGPYRQSERTELYRDHVAQLVETGEAYPCFCTAERLNAVRQRQESEKAEFFGYDGHCRSIGPAEAAARVAAGETHVIRLKTPTDGECVMQDRLRGEVRIPWNMVDDQILMKSDGFPTYHLANVVDDHHMAITHVLRGEEWISSLPKHVQLYRAFGWDAPEFIHLPLLRNPDKSKLSKRKNPTSILYYKRAGFLPEVLINFLGLMAYSMPDGRETFTLDEMVASFDVDRVSLGGPVFDIAKLQNFNGRAIREMSPSALLERLQAWMLNGATWEAVVPLAQPRMQQLADFVPVSSFLFADGVALDPAGLVGKLDPPERAVELLRIAQWEIEKVENWDADAARAVFESLAEKEELKLKVLMPLFFQALTGNKVSLPLYESMEMLGRDLCLRRIHYAVEALEAAGTSLSGKKLKKLTKDYDYRYGRS
jgi:glutamyl-tRNA synthetase